MLLKTYKGMQRCVDLFQDTASIGAGAVSGAYIGSIGGQMGVVVGAAIGAVVGGILLSGVRMTRTNISRHSVKIFD